LARLGHWTRRSDAECRRRPHSTSSRVSPPQVRPEISARLCFARWAFWSSPSPSSSVPSAAAATPRKGRGRPAASDFGPRLHVNKAAKPNRQRPPPGSADSPPGVDHRLQACVCRLGSPQQTQMARRRAGRMNTHSTGPSLPLLPTERVSLASLITFTRHTCHLLLLT
jgi:hypothetical protein